MSLNGGLEVAVKYLQTRPEREQSVHEVSRIGVWPVHVDVEQHRPLRYVLHDRVVVPVKSIQVSIVAQQNVRLQAVLVVGVDSCTHT